MLLDHESCRVAALREYDVLDTPKETDFDKITTMGARLFDVDMTCITLVDKDRFFFKSIHGADVSNLDRRPGFCDTTIQKQGVYCIEDTTQDALVSDHPLVCDEPHVRSYAGSPLITSDGYAIGTFCVMHSEKRVFSSSDKRLLQELSEFVMFHLDRRRLKAMEAHREENRQNAQKLESLGMLAGGIAHDFNNLLVGVLGNASLAAKQIELHSPAQDTISDIVRAAEQASDLTDQLLAYAGQRPSRPKPVNLEQLIEEMKPLLRSSTPPNVSVEVQFAEELPAAVGDPTQLRQVILNLVTNSSEAYEGHVGNILVRISAQERAATHSDDAMAEMSAGRFVCIEVEDTGRGMDEKTLSSIFSPFFSTKVAGRGLGMSIVQRIVIGHGGYVEAESAVGEGCCMRVFIPSINEAAEGEVNGVAIKAELIKGKGTVLIVDDDELVVKMTRSAVMALGFSVLTANNGTDALRFVSSSDRVTLLLLDATMPGMNGAETLIEIRRCRPDLPAVVMSGHHADEVATMFDDFTGLTYLHKPWRLEDLSAAMRSAIEGQALTRPSEAR